MKMLAEWFWTDRWSGSDGWLLPLAARGLYREMLTQAWKRGGSLPNDPASIRALCNVSEADWNEVWPTVQAFWKVVDGRLVNETQVEVYADSTGRKESKVRGGKARAASAERECGRFIPAQPPAQPPAQLPAGEPAHTDKKAPAEHQPPSPSPSLTAIPVQPPSSTSVDSRSDADVARADLRKDLQALRVREHAWSEKTDQEILDRPVFHSTSGGIVRIDTCSSAGLMRATSEKVRAYGQPKPGKARKANGAPAWDRGVDHDVPDEVILAWDPRLGPKPEALREPAITRQTQTQEMPQ